MENYNYKYHFEYLNSSDCFWETKPGKYVKLFTKRILTNLQGYTILDLGAGEGKNAVYLANLGANITAVDVSKIALSRFKQQPNYSNCKEKIKIINDDIENVQFDDNSFDIIIAYGILHCLPNKKSIYKMVKLIKKWTKNNGYFVGVTFTNKIKPPDFQSYLEYESFIDEGELQKMFNTWEIIDSEDDIIKEIHPTSNIEHKHSLTRIIAQKL